MRRHLYVMAGFLLALATGLTGCGSDSNSGGVTAFSYTPVSSGSSWSYQRADNGTQTQRITDSTFGQATREVIDSKTGKSVATINISNNAQYLGSIALYDLQGVYQATKNYTPSPGQMFIPPSTIPGSHETQTVQVTTLPANTTVSSTVDITVVGNEAVTVPAGTFNSALKIQTVTGTTTFTSWFALNVGMIRQDVNGAKSVELTSYSIK